MAQAEPIDVAIPRMGESVIEVIVEEWLRRPGEKVVSGEALVAISTDKVDAEVVAPVDGEVLEVMAEEGEALAVGATIVRLRPAGA